MNKENIPYIIWLAVLVIFGYVSYKCLTSVGANKAYNKIVNDLDDGEVILVRKIKVGD